MTVRLQPPVLTETSSPASSPAPLPSGRSSDKKSNHIHYPESDGQPMADNTKQFHAERQRAERLAAHLRELGIDPDQI